jgi:hypothetical protein
MAPLKARWEQHNLGTIIGSSAGRERLSYMMFADDTTLIAKSETALREMVGDMCIALANIGLRLNPDKCIIQTSCRRNRKNHLVIGGCNFKIVSCDVGCKILGTTFTLNGTSDVEFEARIAAGWAKFHQVLPLLSKRDGNLFKRLQLFDATVSKAVLWCCESWALTVKQRRTLTTTRRIMLRRIAGRRRQPDEEYVTWIKRSTRYIEELSNSAGIVCWQKQYLQKKWMWAGRIAQMDCKRFAHRATIWRDFDWSLEQGAARSVVRARPGNRRRWEDDLRRFASQHGWEGWKIMALTAEWSGYRDEFVQWALR